MLQFIIRGSERVSRIPDLFWHGGIYKIHTLPQRNGTQGSTISVYSGNSESGTFFCVSFPVFMESGEEQHFLRGKPAFRAWTLRRRMLCLQFSFSSECRVIHEHRDGCACGGGCALDKAHMQTRMCRVLVGKSARTFDRFKFQRLPRTPCVH